jgi:hypothetical protein
VAPRRRFGKIGIEGDRSGLRMTQLHILEKARRLLIRPCPRRPVRTGPDIGAQLQTMAERLHYGGSHGSTMAGSHSSAEAATPSVASIKSASQTKLRSVRAKAERPSARPIRVEGMSHEDAHAEQDTCRRDDLAHSFSPCLTGESSTGSFPDDFAELGKWFRRPGRRHGLGTTQL